MVPCHARQLLVSWYLLSPNVPSFADFQPNMTRSAPDGDGPAKSFFAYARPSSYGLRPAGAYARGGPVRAATTLPASLRDWLRPSWAAPTAAQVRLLSDGPTRVPTRPLSGPSKWRSCASRSGELTIAKWGMLKILIILGADSRSAKRPGSQGAATPEKPSPAGSAKGSGWMRPNGGFTSLPSPVMGGDTCSRASADFASCSPESDIQSRWTPNASRGEVGDTVDVHDRAPLHGTPVFGRLCSATMISCFDVP